MPNNDRPTALAHPAFDAVADPTRTVYYTDDFIFGDLTGDDTAAGLGLLQWIVTDVAGSADSDAEPYGTAADVQGHPGVIQLNTGPTTPASGDEASLFAQGLDTIVLPDANPNHIYLAAVVRFPSVTAVEFNFGLFDAKDAAGRGVNGVGVELDVSADTEFNFVTTAASSSTATASTVTAAIDTWYLFEILAHEDECQLFIDGEFAARHTATIPANVGLAPGFKVATETAGEKSVLIDLFALRFSTDRRGGVAAAL